MTKIGYMRVSTDKQDHALQQQALTKAGCTKIYADTISGKSTSRPSFDRMLAESNPGDHIVVWKLDRLGRSLVHVVQTVNDFKARNINFTSLTETIDTSTPMGEFTFHLMAALGQLERQIIRERVVAGLDAAKAAGKKLGRTPSVRPQSEVSAVRALYEQGCSIREIASRLDMNRGKVERIRAAIVTPRAPRTAPSPPTPSWKDLV